MAKKRVNLVASALRLIGAMFTLIMLLSVGGCTEDPAQQNKKLKSSPQKNESSSSSKDQLDFKPGLLSEAQTQFLKLEIDPQWQGSKMRWYLEPEEASENCRKSQDCRLSGLCSQVSLRSAKALPPAQTKCIALSRQRCLGSRACQNHGMCTPEAGRCVVKSDLDCFQSQRCKFYGLCHLQDDRCVAKSDDNCKQSQACRDFQTCSYQAGICVNAEDLAKSCDYGCVRLDSGCFCHPDPPEVKPSKSFEPACLSSCRKSGECSLGESGCAPRSQSDCASSERCQSEGLCDFNQGRCVKSASGCASSLECSLVGRCLLRDGRCVASSQEDCLSSRACAEKERCYFEADKPKKASTPIEDRVEIEVVTGQCVREEQPLDCRDLCNRTGQCEALDNSCLATSSSHCRSAEVCKKYGLCSARGGQCVAISSMDCKRSLNCKQLGRCTAKKGRCLQ